MADILAFKKPKPGQKHQGKTLCRHNFHKWVEDKKLGFDVKEGKLVTRYRCTRCDATRVKST